MTSLTALSGTIGTLDTSFTNLTSTVHSLVTGGSSAVFVDSERRRERLTAPTVLSPDTDAGACGSLSPYFNGLLLTTGTHFTLAGATVICRKPEQC